MNRPIHKGDAAYDAQQREQQFGRDVARAFSVIWVDAVTLVAVIVLAVLALMGKLP